MPYADLDGCSIAYQEAGAGTPLVFLHGFVGSMEAWTPQMRHFARHYRTVAYNAKGYPPSAVPEDMEAYTQDHQVAVLRGLLEHLGTETAYVCGLSMGAHTAIAFTLEHPERVRGLIAVGAGSGSQDPDQFRQGAEERARSLLEQGQDGLSGLVGGPRQARMQSKDPAGTEAMRRIVADQSPLGLANTNRGFQALRPSLYTYEDRLARLEVPTLVCVGDEDGGCIEPSLFLKRTVPRCGLAMFPQSGHSCCTEEPHLFNQVLGSFLTAVEHNAWEPAPARG